MRALIIATLATAFAITSAHAAETADKPDKSLFERNHEALQRAERRGDIEPRTRPDRLINNSITGLRGLRGQDYGLR
jgi:hypothetical protein